MTSYHFGPFRLDKEQLLLSLNESPLALGPKVVETLLALVEHPGEVLSKTALLDRVWPDGFVEEANLAQNIYVIRKMLRAHWDANAIGTVPRRGYRFTAPVRFADAETISAAQFPRTSTGPAGSLAGVAAALILAIALGSPIAWAPARSHAVQRTRVAALSVGGARLYAIGKFYWNQRTAAGVTKSIRYFEAVVQSDPTVARGYAALAEAYAITADYRYGPLSRNASLARAHSYARKALSLDANSAEAHSALGITEYTMGNAAVAQSEFRRAIALNPRDASSHQWYGMSLLREGKTAAAFAELQKAANLDPVSVATTDWLSNAAYFTRRYRSAIGYARQALDLSPQRLDAYASMGLAYEALGDYRSAIAAYRAYARRCEGCKAQAAAMLAHAYAASHEYANARFELRIAQEGIASRRVDPEDVVAALVALGRQSEALRMLREAGKGSATMLALDPRMDPVRHDARFRAYTQGPA